MIRIKDHKTPYIFDQFGYLGPKRRKLLDESWAGIFRKYVLTELPVERLAKNKFHARQIEFSGCQCRLIYYDVIII